MDKRLEELRYGEFLKQENDEDHVVVLKKISDSSKMDYEKIVRREKIKKTFRFIFLIFILLVVLTITGIITYLYYTNKSKEDFISSQSRKIFDLENRMSYITQQEEEQESRIENYQAIVNKKISEIEDKNITGPVHRNLIELNNILRNVSYENIFRGNQNLKNISLTFDLATGEDCEFLYKLIEKTGIKVTIFVSNETADYKTGSLFHRRNIYWLKKFAGLGDKVEFGNHTWSHFNLVNSLTETSFKRRHKIMNISREPLNLEKFHAELMHTRDRFYNITGRSLSNIWRAPYGAVNELVLKMAAKFGYNKHIFWSNNGKRSLDIPDYISRRLIRSQGKFAANPLYMTGDEALQMLLDWEKTTTKGMNGAIILMHLGTNRKIDKLINILPEFVRIMQDKGYNFVTVSESLQN